MKKWMSWLLILGMGLFGCAPAETPDDGGITHHQSGDDAPKYIESDEIVSFRCEESFFASPNEIGVFAGRVYTMTAVKENDAVHGKFEWRDRDGNGEVSSFTADDSFLTALQSIVKQHDFAQYNGFLHTASGLPDHYGTRLTVEYASGEQIYAHDNQSGILPLDASKDLIALFEQISSK